VNVHVVAPDHEPLERVMGAQIGKFVRGLHESHGVVFHLGETITQVKGRKAVLKSGKTLDVDFLVLGVGVKPSTKLAEDAGLRALRFGAIFLDSTVRRGNPLCGPRKEVVGSQNRRQSEIEEMRRYVPAKRAHVSCRHHQSRSEKS
jgi:hypothetical protein